MPVKKIPLFLLIFSAAGFFILSGAETSRPQGKELEKSSYFQNSGSQMDSLLDRIRFKIYYSWEKSGEYFRLACSSVTDSAAPKQRDAEARIILKKDDLLEKGKQTVRESARQTIQNLSRKGEELKQDLHKAGEEVKSEISDEFRKNTDQMFK